MARATLEWMKERNLLYEECILFHAAAREGHIEVLEWLCDNDYNPSEEIFAIVQGAAHLNNDDQDYIKILTWVRERGISLDEHTCMAIAFLGHLPMLQWLRENGCPWDEDVIGCAIQNGHVHIVEWAIANGCPKPLQ
jgi:hypothetical protein